jgi:serine/threonine-protein kinase
MLRLFDGGEKEAGPADNLRVVTLIDRGLLDARTLDREPLVQAELYETLGSIYERLGKFDQADTLLQSSIEARRSLLPSNSPDIARGVTALARLRSDQARFDEAERMAREGLTVARATLQRTIRRSPMRRRRSAKFSNSEASTTRRSRCCRTP